MQQLWDELVLGLVEGWVVLRHNRLWRRVRRRLKAEGVARTRIASPRLANEKFAWRKLFDHNPVFPTLTDKIACKEWVRRQDPDVRIPQTLWIGSNANDIPDDVWKRPMFVKGAHGCRMNLPVLSETIDRAAIVADANEYMAKRHGVSTNEWSYTQIPARLLAEEAIFIGKELIDMKFYCYGGRVEQYLLLRNGNPLTAGRWVRQEDGTFALSEHPAEATPHIDHKPPPKTVAQGLAIAEKLGAQFDQMRVDTMTDGDALYVGELTVYSKGGRAYFEGYRPDSPSNRSWDLRKSWFLKEPQRGWRKLYANSLRRCIDRREKMGHGLS